MEGQTQPKSRSNSIVAALSWFRDLAFSVLLAVILIVFIYQPVKVEGTSMMPTLTDQERIFINKFTYHFGLGDIQRGELTETGVRSSKELAVKLTNGRNQGRRPHIPISLNKDDSRQSG